MPPRPSTSSSHSERCVAPVSARARTPAAARTASAAAARAPAHPARATDAGVHVLVPDPARRAARAARRGPARRAGRRLASSGLGSTAAATPVPRRPGPVTAGSLQPDRGGRAARARGHATRIRTAPRHAARTDAQLFIVLDTSRSMAAAPSPTSPTRLGRAERMALRPSARVGVPVGSRDVHRSGPPGSLPERRIGGLRFGRLARPSKRPPPQNVSTVAHDITRTRPRSRPDGFFPSSVHKRVVVV